MTTKVVIVITLMLLANVGLLFGIVSANNVVMGGSIVIYIGVAVYVRRLRGSAE